MGKMALRTQLLWFLDRWFPPNPAGFLSASEETAYEADKAPTTMGAYLDTLGRTDADILDFGCGWGGETLWLARRVRSVVGVDVDEGAIRQATRALEASGVTNCRFFLAGATLPLPSASFDAVFSTNTFEHVQDIHGAYAELFRVLRPGGWLIAQWAPLFYSPHGYHLYWACQVPYAHLIGGLRAVRDLRNARSRDGQSTATTWADLGLNGLRFRDYRRAAASAGFLLHRFDPQAVRGLNRLAGLPLVGDLFIFGVHCAIQKPALAGGFSERPKGPEGVANRP